MKLIRLFSMVFMYLLLSSHAHAQEGDDEGDDILLMIPSLIASTQEVSETVQIMRDLLREHNAARSKVTRCGSVDRPPVAPLTWNSKLAQAAVAHSEDMNENSFFDHTGSDDSTLGVRVNRVNYVWSNLAENIAVGFTDGIDVTAAWVASTGHCNNIMNGTYIHMGGAKSGRYWTVVFGRGE